MEVDAKLNLESELDAEQTLESVGYVYAMSTDSLSMRGIYKIGSTDDLDRRRKDLSHGTSVPEDFFISCFVRCPTVADARKLENWVQNELNKLGARHHKRREFYRIGTIVGLPGCFSAGAKFLGISIVPNVRACPKDILENDDNFILLHENLESIDSIYHEYYRRGARDLAAMLLLTYSGNEIGVVAGHIMAQLDGSVIGYPSSNNLVSVVENAIGVHSNQETVRKFLQEVKGCRDDDDERAFGSAVDGSDWREFINTSLNWPRDTP